MGMPENRQLNRRHDAKLTPEMEAAKFKPGQSGNPGGRPKRGPLTDAYERALSQLIPGDKEGRTIADLIAAALVKQAAKGNLAAVRELADRVEGKAVQPVQPVEKDDESNVIHRVVVR